MDIFSWFLQKSASEQVTALSANSELFIAYVALSLIIKRSVFLLAFFISCLLFECGIFDSLKEYQLYLITMVMYSYVFSYCKSLVNRFGCVIILILSFTLAVDAFFFGANGYFTENETFIHNNIYSFALFAHAFFICSFINIKRILDGIRDFIDHVVSMSPNSAYLFWYCYNKVTIRH